MEKEVVIGSKKFKLKEILYLDMVVSQSSGDAREKALKLLELSGLSPDEVKNLTLREGAEIMDEINKLNGFVEDFQKTNEKD